MNISFTTHTIICTQAHMNTYIHSGYFPISIYKFENVTHHMRKKINQCNEYGQRMVIKIYLSLHFHFPKM